MTFQVAKIYVNGKEFAWRASYGAISDDDDGGQVIADLAGTVIAEFDVECAVPLGGFDFAAAKYFGAREADLAASLGDVSLKLVRKWGILYFLTSRQGPPSRRERRRLRLAMRRTVRTIEKLTEVQRG